MTVSLAQLAEAIEERARFVPGLRVASYVPEDANPPFAFVSFGTIDRTAMQLGIREVQFELIICTSSAVDRAGQHALYRFANPDPTDDQSVWAAFETNKDLGLNGLDVTLLRYRPFGIDEIAAYRYFGGAFEGVAHVTKS